MLLVDCKCLSAEILYISINPFYWAFKTKVQANTPTAVLKKARALVPDVYVHFTWETDDTIYQRADGLAKCQQETIELCTGI